MADRFLSGPTYGKIYREMRASFPQEFERLVALAEANSNADQATQLKLGFDHMGQFIVSHMSDVASAPDAELAAFLRGQATFIQRLSEENVQYCADFGMRGLDRYVQLSPRAEEAAGELTFLSIKAARAGIDHPTARGIMTREEAGVLIDAVEKAAGDPDLVQAFLKGGLATRPPKDQCAMSLALYRALVDTPPSVGLKYIVHTLTALKATKSQP